MDRNIEGRTDYALSSGLPTSEPDAAHGQLEDRRIVPTSRSARFILLVYRVPARPTANRVYVWRMLKKVGAVYLQQSVTVFPQNKQVAHDLQAILKKIDDSSGEYYLLPLRQLPPAEMAKLVAQFVDQTARHYQEIIENCEINFTKEIEFETFRGNLTYEEAEEIRADYEKIVSWFERVRERDWFGAPNRSEAQQWLDRCARLLEEFEAEVFRSQASLDHPGGPPGLTHSYRAGSRARRRRPAAPALVPLSAAGPRATARGGRVRPALERDPTTLQEDPAKPTTD